MNLKIILLLFIIFSVSVIYGSNEKSNTAENKIIQTITRITTAGISILIISLVIVTFSTIKIKKAKAKLLESVNKYNILINNIPGVTYRCAYDDDWTMEFLGNGIEEMTGYKASNFIGNKKLTFESIIHPDDRDYVRSIIGISKPYSLEYRIISKNDEIKWIYEKGRGIFDSKGDFKHLDGILIDITDKKKTEVELFKYKTELEEIVKNRTIELEASIENLTYTQNRLVESEKMASLGRLVSGVAHLINTPVGIGITSTSYLIDITNEMKKIFSSNEITKQGLKSYLNSIAETSELVISNFNLVANIVKTFKQITVDLSSEDKRTFEVRKYLRDLVEGFYPTSSLNNITITIDCPDPIIITNYPGALSRVINSLISNSLQHAFNNIKNGEIKIKIFSNKQDLNIVYTDNGIGMSEVDLNRIFDPFFTTDRKNKLFGLGLNITHNLVTQALGGNIYCFSQENFGTEFNIIFPKNI